MLLPVLDVNNRKYYSLFGAYKPLDNEKIRFFCVFKFIKNGGRMNKRIFYVLFCVSSLFFQMRSSAEDVIEIEKQNVLHRFIPYDQPTDNFVKNIFLNWEPETFAVFDSVKDPNGIAIDLGAWIGTTSIWLSKNFNYVLAVEPDQTSIHCLKQNLAASNCDNVGICENPVNRTSEYVIFGPRYTNLNDSTSYVKNVSDNSNDYSIRGITFKQLIYDKIFSNKKLTGKKISFIKCDIEGAEENVLEDILYFAYYNKIKVYLSFHLDFWKSHKIDEFAYLFDFFETDCKDTNLCDYLKKHPFGSVFFQPKNNSAVMVKKNMPIVIIGYQLVSLIKNTVNQIERYTKDIIVVDNNSDYQPLLDYYKNEFKYTLIKLNQNCGSGAYGCDFVQKFVGDVYLITDPDLQFNPLLPDDFIEQMYRISNYFQASKVGFALDIFSADINPKLRWNKMAVKEWELHFWNKRVVYPADSKIQTYIAEIDTTFCLVNKKTVQRCQIRVGGNYTCRHLPWHNNFQEILLPGEYESYKKNNISTSWKQQ